jgi:hypothetical protein
MDLFRFSADSFEQFVQAMAIRIFGPGVKVFGSGPDGGREATFDGPVDYPSTSDEWNGYGVIQAKCKEKTEGTRKDQEWALELLRSELEEFVRSEPGCQFNEVPFDPKPKEGPAPKARTRLPEYFIFATNVVLTSASGGGGKDRADEIFKEFQKKLPLKGYGVWDSVQLQSYITAYTDIRNRFTQFLTPSDLLAAVVQEFADREEDFENLLHVYLDRTIRNDQDSRLDQGEFWQRGGHLFRRCSLSCTQSIERCPAEMTPNLQRSDF